MVTPADDRQFDDHFNVWTESSHLPPGCVLGEAVGSQPTHGFINWIGFDRPIKRLTVCLGAHTRNFRNDPVQLSIVGLKIDSQDSKPALLGRCTSLGSFFELDDDDCLVGFTIGITATPRSRIIREILFNTKKNLCIGFRDDQLVYSTDADGDKQVFRTIGNLCLIGFAWSFDLGPGSVGDQGIQPLYRLLDNPEVLNAAQNSLYPSIVWNHPPPPSVQLRPIPEMKSNRFDFASSLSYSDDIEKFADFNLTAIHVYYNAFIQGIMFEYKDGLARVLGNKVGAKEVFRLEDERVTTVWFRERVQKLFGMSLPREIICVDGIRVSQQASTSLGQDTHICHSSALLNGSMVSLNNVSALSLDAHNHSGHSLITSVAYGTPTEGAPLTGLAVSSHS